MKRHLFRVSGLLAALLLLIGIGIGFNGTPTLNVAAQTAGTNWTGQFYNNTTLTDPVVDTLSFPNGLNFIWPGSPDDGQGNVATNVNPDNFSARIVTTEFFDTGLYEFVLTYDDGIRLFVNGLLQYDDFANTGQKTESVLLNFSGGANTIIIEYVERSDLAILQVTWFISTGTPVATNTPVPAALGVVERVRGLAIRTGPYLGASLIGVARPEKEYPLVARNTSEGLFTWYLLIGNEEITGWSSGRYLGIIGDENLLPFVGSVFDEINAPRRVGVIGTTRAVMNFRVRPSVRTQRIGQIPWGDQVEIVGRTIQGGEDFWYHVYYGDQLGWIFAPYVGITSGLIDAVPIY